jgi:tRNA A-37 threonylcarbamoyl transferase component Bud32
MLLRTKTVIAPGWETVLRMHGFDSVEGIYRIGSGTVVTHNGSTEVRRVDVGSGSETRTIFIKKYWVTKPAQLWNGMFRGTFFGRSKARREFQNLARLRAWGLDAPEPVAYGEERVVRWLVRSYLISLGVPQPVPLHLYIGSHLAALPPEEARRSRRELIDNLADCTRRLHEHRFVHHDYFWRNILLANHDMQHFHLIDAHKGRLWHPGESQRARARDLAALDAPAPSFFRRSERLRFFLRYRGHRRLTVEDRKLLLLTLDLAAPMRDKQLRRAVGR